MLKKHILHAWITPAPTLKTARNATKHINGNGVEIHKYDIQKHVDYLSHILWMAIWKIRYTHFNDNLQSTRRKLYFLGDSVIITFGRLWKTMEEKGMTQYALINKYGFSEAAIYALRHDKNMTAETHTILYCKLSDISEYASHLKQTKLS